MIHFEQKHRTILAYLKAYNALDIPGMLRCLHHEVLFENYAGQQRTLRLEGIKAFENQAHTALAFFSEREQVPSNWRFEEDSVCIDVHFRATPSLDFP
ncbi:MAG: nuclear transport factor 2 family protein, partial [Bacteroidota bacterium]